MQSDMRNLRKERQGIVSSNKMDKTITVAVKWKEKHPIYGKIPRSRRKQRMRYWRYGKNNGNSSFKQT